MPYVKKQFSSIKGKKIEEFLINDLTFKDEFLLKLLKEGKVFDDNNKIIKQKQNIKSENIFITIFEASSRGLKPIFENYHFAVYDKPSGLKVHPNSSKDYSYTLFDEIKARYKDASLINRIDKETSGLVLVAKNRFADFTLKASFEKREVKKKYLALVNGIIKEQQTIKKKIGKSNSIIKLKMNICEKGKDSITKIKPLNVNTNLNQTLLEVEPLTGRQHQIRVHLNSIGHNIIGDPIYGLKENIADKILENKISENERIKYTKSKRLMLQANYLEFEFLGVFYKISSKQNLL